MNLPILYQDDDLVTVNKPSKLSAHRGWDRDGVYALNLMRAQLGRYVYLPHRLDRATSGAMIFALNKPAAAALGRAFREGLVRKYYLALVRGITPEHGVIDSPVPKSRKGPRVEARTDFVRLGTFERYSLVQANPKTGRLHQIRRHLKHISHPLIGDVRYGKGEHNRLFRRRFGLDRLALHAVGLSFPHPAWPTQRVVIRAGLPEDFAGPLAAMGLDACLGGTAWAC